MNKKPVLLFVVVAIIMFFIAYGLTSKDNITSELLLTKSSKPQISSEPSLVEEKEATIEISLWTFPVGAFVNEELVESFIDDFNEIYPNIKVNVRALDYASGDKEVEAAIEARMAPDVIMEGPERLVANWGARGLLIDLKSLWDKDTIANISAISPKVIDACRAPDGAFYEYPMVMTTHVMAINYELFKKAGALKYIDEKNRSWTVEGFVSAMEAVRDSGLVDSPGVIYTGGQGGDQGTRALVTNLYNAPFTDSDHTVYTINSNAGVNALELLQEMVESKALAHNPTIVASDELKMFATEKIAVSFAWNATNESYYASQVGFTPFAMNFPSADSIAELQGGIWGFAIFNKGKQDRVDAAKKLIRFLVDDPIQGKKSVMATQFFSVKKNFQNVYLGTKDEQKMAVYASFLANLGDYYQVSPEWTNQRIAWYEMLQKVFAGQNAKTAVDNYADSLNNYISQ